MESNWVQKIGFPLTFSLPTWHRFEYQLESLSFFCLTSNNENDQIPVTGRYPRHLIVSDYTVTFRLQVALSKFRVIQSTPTAKTEWLEDGNWDPCEAIRKRHARWVNSCQERTLNCHSVPSFKTLVPICQASLPKIFLPSRWIKVVSKKMVVEVWIIPSARLLSDVLKSHGSEIFQGLNSCRWQPAIYLAFQPDSSCFEARLASIFTSDRRSHFWLTHSRVF